MCCVYVWYVCGVWCAYKVWGVCVMCVVCVCVVCILTYIHIINKNLLGGIKIDRN